MEEAVGRLLSLQSVLVIRDSISLLGYVDIQFANPVAECAYHVEAVLVLGEKLFNLSCGERAATLQVAGLGVVSIYAVLQPLNP